MKKVLIVAGVVIAFAFSEAKPLANVGIKGAKGPQAGILSSTGGPDDYGYTWIDNDTTGGPTFNWVDITDIGTKVEGLSDDNVVGPFSIGFEFPYYWYKVDKFWICSNGVISFASGDLWVPHNGGSVIPSPSPPNDVVAPLGGDLNFAGEQGEVYYYSNGVDSLIVSFIDAPEWHYGTNFYGSHTFQLILDKDDSTITFQYGPQDGNFNYGGGAPVAVGIGIENVTGQIGLQYLLDNNPEENLYHDSLAILFAPPESTTYQVKDIALVEAGNTLSQGLFILQNSLYTPYNVVKNAGTQEISSFTSTIGIKYLVDDTPLVYADTVIGGPLAPGEVDTLTFEDWTPQDDGAYMLESYVSTDGDMNPTNNYSDIDLRVVGEHATLDFINDSFNLYMIHWMGAGGGYGQKFTPPSYPCEIETVYVMLGVAQGSTPDYAYLYLFDDDGDNGLPGTILAADTFYVDIPYAWFPIIPDTPIEIEDGSFYVGSIQGGDNGPDFIVDIAPPISRLAYEYTGAWSPSRDKETQDMDIKVMVEMPPVLVSEGSSPSKNGFSFLKVYPNIVKKMARFKFGSDSKGVVRVLLYDVTGKSVLKRDIVVDGPGIQDGLLDFSNLRSGVYFLKLRKNEKESSSVPILHIDRD